MKNRKLGQIQVSPIGMGCMGFSHGYGRVPEESYSVEAIRKAYEYGCTFFDTAESYGKEQFYPGHNEELVGKAVEPFRKQAVVATKFHITNAEMEAQGFHLYQAIRRHLEDSLKRLRTDYIDLYYLHRVNEQIPVEDIAVVMGQLIEEGPIRGWGMSQVDVYTLDRAHKVTPISAVPIPGSKNQERILENLGGWNVQLTDDEFAALEKALNACTIHGHRGHVETENAGFRSIEIFTV